jgi:chromosome segregation ATPase
MQSTVRTTVGLGADLTALRTEVALLLASMPDRSQAEAAIESVLSRLDAALGERDAQLRGAVERLEAAMGERDVQLRGTIDRLDSAVITRESDVADTIGRLDAAIAGRDEHLRETLGRIDATIAASDFDREVAELQARLDIAVEDLRRDVQSADNAAPLGEVLETVRALALRDPDEPARSVNSSLRDVRADLQSSRAELQTLARAFSDLSAEVRRPPADDMGAALVASAAAAMARLEGRMENEFDNVGRNLEALGTLLGQVIEAVHRVESGVVGTQPVSDRMRSAAAAVLESLRANVRQRQARRSGGGPPELGSGHLE